MAQAQIIGGNFHTGHFLWNTLEDVRMGAMNGIGGESLRGRVASIQVVREDQGKSFLKATAAGLAGGALAGPVGALAGVAAGGNTKQILFLVTTHQGAQFLAKGDPKIYELLVTESLKPKADPPKMLSAQILSGSLQGEIRRQDGLLKVYGTSDNPPVILSGRIADLGILESSGENVRFECCLKDNSHFIAEGDRGIYEALDKTYVPREGRFLLGCFLAVLFVVFAVTCHFLASA